MAATLVYCLNKKQLIQAFGGATKLVTQLVWAARHRPELGWLKIAREGKPGVELLVDRVSADKAYERILAGEEPPLMPSQIRFREQTQQAKAKAEKANAKRSRKNRAPAPFSLRESRDRTPKWGRSSNRARLYAIRRKQLRAKRT